MKIRKNSFILPEDFKKHANKRTNIKDETNVIAKTNESKHYFSAGQNVAEVRT